MLLVHTTVRPSTVANAGLGLFADEPIKEGHLIWELSTFDLRFTDRDLRVVPLATALKIQHYAYRHGDQWILCFDDGRFINHSKTPNLVSTNPFRIFAKHDIEVGDELFEDYQECDESYRDRLKQWRERML